MTSKFPNPADIFQSVCCWISLLRLTPFNNLPLKNLYFLSSLDTTISCSSLQLCPLFDGLFMDFFASPILKSGIIQSIIIMLLFCVHPYTVLKSSHPLTIVLATFMCWHLQNLSDLSSVFQIPISNCLLDTFTWKSHSHLRLCPDSDSLLLTLPPPKQHF